MLLPVPLYEQEQPYSCIAAAARMVLAYLGLPKAEEDLRRLLKVKWTGAHPVSLCNLCELGIEARLEYGDILTLGVPLVRSVPRIVFLDTGLLSHWSPSDYAFLHAVVVVGVGATGVTVNDPYYAQAPVAVPAPEFDAAWDASGRLMVTLAWRG